MQVMLSDILERIHYHTTLLPAFVILLKMIISFANLIIIVDFLLDMINHFQEKHGISNIRYIFYPISKIRDNLHKQCSLIMYKKS